MSGKRVALAAAAALALLYLTVFLIDWEVEPVNALFRAVGGLRHPEAALAGVWLGLCAVAVGVVVGVRALRRRRRG